MLNVFNYPLTQFHIKLNFASLKLVVDNWKQDYFLIGCSSPEKKKSYVKCQFNSISNSEFAKQTINLGCENVKTEYLFFFLSRTNWSISIFIWHLTG